ncbi:SDR family oxidoreductase [Nitratireductor sp. ZSWI3]|uniref:SDR family oxidoreductase n=1 Tax=Nitratireductor sp. ZSWI3 TaxID=2966359 RepID=UPI0021500859|nr:SDR family oxidoreductase [Nitratireductor sp. ZSWI3]MCR4265028.1 SDR family oxidoreductase [Nitratireductor sp. ZSWI3]
MGDTKMPILITGAAGGIGRAIASRLAKDGHRLVLSDMPSDRLAQIANNLPGNQHLIVECDLRDPRSRARLAEAGEDAGALINAAGWQRQTPFLKGSTDDDAQMFDINVLATIDLCRRIGGKMAARGEGHIINISSALARAVYPYTTVYAATKHALAAVTQGLRVELSHHGIRVTEICPGLVGGTGILDATEDPEVLASIRNRGYQPILPDDVADAVSYALSTPANVELRMLEIRPRGQL